MKPPLWWLLPPSKLPSNLQLRSTARSVIDNLHLLRIANYTATQQDDQYNVRVAWQYADEHNGVWDDRAKMMLRVTLKNAAGDTIDVKEYELNKAEREQCYKVLDLSRTCVKYDIEMYVDRGTSPLNLYDAEKMKDYYFPIRNAQDWTTFRDMVDAAEGKRAVNQCVHSLGNKCRLQWRLRRQRSHADRQDSR